MDVVIYNIFNLPFFMLFHWPFSSNLREPQKSLWKKKDILTIIFKVRLLLGIIFKASSG